VIHKQKSTAVAPRMRNALSATALMAAAGFLSAALAGGQAHAANAASAVKAAPAKAAAASAAKTASPAITAAEAAVGAPVPAAERDAVTKYLAIRGLREEQIQSVTRAPDDRFDLVVARQAGIPNDILYVSRDGRFAFSGDLIDLKTGVNLTGLAQQKINSVDFAKLPLELAVKNGNGARKLVVFADPNCPYCKKLEIEQLTKLKNITVYTFVIPILAEDSRVKAMSIACSKSPLDAWEGWMTKNQAPTAAPCTAGAERVNKSMSLANSLRVQATPTMFFEDGSRMAGAQSTEELETRLAQAQISTKKK